MRIETSTGFIELKKRPPDPLARTFEAEHPFVLVAVCNGGRVYVPLTLSTLAKVGVAAAELLRGTLPE